MKKSDQCRAILVASILFVTSESTLEPEIMKCYRKCIKIANSVLDIALQLQLHVETLSSLTLYIRFKNDEITELIQSLVGLIVEKRNESPLSELAQKQFNNTVAFFRKNGIDLPTVE